MTAASVRHQKSEAAWWLYWIFPTFCHITRSDYPELEGVVHSQPLWSDFNAKKKNRCETSLSISFLSNKIKYNFLNILRSWKKVMNHSLLLQYSEYCKMLKQLYQCSKCLLQASVRKRRSKKQTKYCSRNINGHELECVLCVLPVGMLHSQHQ